MQNNFYVYRHVRLDSNIPFYVGKGKNRRAFQNSQRTYLWKNIVRKAGYKIEIIKYFNTSIEAYNFEQKLIKLYKNYNLCKANLSDGGPGRSGYSLSKESRMKISRANSGKNNGMSDSIGFKNPSYGSGHKLLCLNNNKIYISSYQANKELGITNSLKVAKGERSNSGGYKFIILESYSNNKDK